MTPIHDETVELLRHLFAPATGILERALDAAVEGQAATGSAEHFRACAAGLSGQLEDAQAVAAEAEAIARAAPGSHRTS